MRERYEKNMVLIKEEKEGENDRINTGGKMEDGQVVAQKKEKATSQISMVALAFSSYIFFSLVSHSSPKTSLLIVRPAMTTAFVSPVARSLVQDGQIVASKERTSRH